MHYSDSSLIMSSLNPESNFHQNDDFDVPHLNTANVHKSFPPPSSYSVDPYSVTIKQVIERVCVCVCVCAFAHVFVCVCVCACICTCVYVWVYVCVCIHLHMCVCACLLVCVSLITVTSSEPDSNLHATLVLDDNIKTCLFSATHNWLLTWTYDSTEVGEKGGSN